MLKRHTDGDWPGYGLSPERDQMLQRPNSLRSCLTMLLYLNGPRDGNPLLAPEMEAHWAHTQRVMGEVLIRDDKPNDAWEQHQALLEVVIKGQAAQAERLAKKHILDAADLMIKRLRSEGRTV